MQDDLSLYYNKLEMLIWRPRPNSPTYLQDHTIYLIQLNNVHNEINKGAAILCSLPLSHGGLEGIPLPLIQQSHLRPTLRGKCWPVRLCSQKLYFELSSSRTIQTFRELFAWCCGLKAQHISKTLNKSMFDTYPHDNYSLRPR